MGLLAPTATHKVDNLAGWTLDVRVYRDPATLVPGRAPVVMIPGYAMNGHVLAFHPRGPSMVEHLVADGAEVWVANLRGQGDSTPLGRPARFGMAELALDDLPRVFDVVKARTATGADRLSAIGCSLGASYLYAYLAAHPTDHPFDRVVAIGGPLRWTTVHPLLRAAFVSSRLAGIVPIKGTRPLAKAALPLLVKVPSLLGLYMNADAIDLSQADMLVPTVEDPIPGVNYDIARWVKETDLRLRGLPVTKRLGLVHDLPVLALLANKDGIVPPQTARAVAAAMPRSPVDILEVGTDAQWYAHADLFIGDRAQQEVFVPLSSWLRGEGL